MPGATTVKLVEDAQIKRVVLCSGKVYFDLMEEREKRGETAFRSCVSNSFIPSRIRCWRWS